VEVGDLRSDSIGRGAGDSTRAADQPELPQLFSQGFVRGKLHKLNLVSNKIAGNGATAAAVMLQDPDLAEPQAYLQSPQQPATVQVGTMMQTQVTSQLREKVREAKAKGYEGDACIECGNFTMVRNGTCMKCDTCGGTSGCS